MKIRLASVVEEGIKFIDRTKLIRIADYDLERRIEGEFCGDAFWLTSKYDWHIGTDNEDELILVATKK